MLPVIGPKLSARCVTLLVLPILWLCFSLSAQASLPVMELSGLDREPLRHKAGYWQADPESTLEQALQADFAPLNARTINQGISDRAYWLRLRLHNSREDAKRWVLIHETSYLDNIDVFLRDESGRVFEHQHLSDRVPFNERPLDYRKLGFEHTTPAHSYTDVYLKLYYEEGKPDSISLQFTLYDAERFQQWVREENLLFGGYYGILTVLVLIAAIVGLLLKRISVLNYGFFLIATGFQWLLLNGYGFQYLWPNSVYWHNEGFHISYLLFSLMACEFSKTFLRTADRFPGVHRLLQATQVIALVGVAIRLFGWYLPALHLSFALLTVVAVLVPLISWRAWRRGVHYARWYLFAWLIYSVSLLLSLASAYLNIVPWGMHSLALLQWGSLLEAIFLTVAITERLLSVETERRKAVELANQDPLTGLGNRRLLQRQYERFRDQFDRDGSPVFLIMIDLDHFKVVNDRYGHDAGDEVLREVAKLLKAHCRTSDVCIRYGGEEFAVLLQAENLDAAWHIAERIRKEFADNPTRYHQDSIEHTLSSGITSVLDANQQLTVNQMMKYADQALYEGKAAGRNCNVVYRAEATLVRSGNYPEPA